MIIESPFRPAWWLRNGHAQTVWPALFRKTVAIDIKRERLELPDGDFIDLDWCTSGSGPVVLLLHGLEGSINSHYARGMMRTLQSRGLRPVMMHFRGCSGEHNRLARSYHSGDTGDLGYVIETLQQRFPGTDLFVVGYSLGGNVTLKYLGEKGEQSGIAKAAVVSVPFELASGTDRLSRGFSKLYQQHLINKLQVKIIDKFKNRNDAPFHLHDVTRWRDFHTFDNYVTAPLHGFDSSDDYYERSSSRQYLPHIRTRTLILHADDDPFLPITAVPGNNELPEPVTLELCRGGGHVGFISGAVPWRPRYWLEERIPDFLDKLMNKTPPPQPSPVKGEGEGK